jgi:hypothetical protein
MKNISDFNKISLPKNEINSSFRLVLKNFEYYDYLNILSDKGFNLNLVRILNKYCILSEINNLFAFKHFNAMKSKLNEKELNCSWNVYNIKKEFERQGINFEEDKWKLSTINQNYELCDR